MRLTLVLGSGGARGYAHLGVLAALRERGHEVVAISGTSMGALVGGLAAAGRDEEFADWARTLTQAGVLRLMDPARLSAPGAVRGNRVIERISGILGDIEIEDLPIPFTAVAADLTNQREVWFQRGPLIAAIRASIAIPGALTPVQMGGRLLVDGGILNPVPMEPVLAVPADFTVAVDLSGQDHQRRASPVAEEAEVAGDPRSWLARIGFGARDRDRDRDRDREPDGDREPDADRDRKPGRAKSREADRDQKPTDDGEMGALAVMLRSFETMQQTISRYRTATNPPDVLISVPATSARTLEFHRAAELIDLGRDLANAALDDAGL